MFELNRYLQERRALVDHALDRALPAASDRPRELAEAMRYSIFSGGKRLRPILCLAAAEAAGGELQPALPAAMAVEILHTYTLVHDDLPCMDDDDERRGKPTLHKAYGEANAVLAGDALLTLAFQILATSPATDALPELIHTLSVRAGGAGVIGGQWEDIRCSGSSDPATIAFVHQHKTADLFYAAIRMGALSVTRDPERIEPLSTYGNALGLAFQIIDDILDGTPDTGEPADELTCLSLWSLDEAKREAARLTGEAIEALGALPGPTDPLAAAAEFMLARTY